MNETIKNLVERRSCRKYSSTQIKEDELNSVLKAGEYAPSGMGRQSTIMVAVTNKEVRDRLSRLNAECMNSTADPFYGAPVVIVVLADKNAPTHVYDGALTMQNLMLAADSKGIGSCWIHRAKEVFASEEGKQLLKDWGIEGDYEGIGNCILGYPAEETPKAKERKANRIYWVK